MVAGDQNPTGGQSGRDFEILVEGVLVIQETLFLREVKIEGSGYFFKF